MAPPDFPVSTMTEQTSTLYAKLLGETAMISWQELQPFFARGALQAASGLAGRAPGAYTMRGLLFGDA